MVATDLKNLFSRVGMSLGPSLIIIVLASLNYLANKAIIRNTARAS